MTSVDTSLDNRCLDALRKAWELGASSRSQKKLKVLCQWIREEILKKLAGYEVYATGDGKPENKRKVDGKYYQKKVNIAISRGDCELGAISVRLIESSYKKNVNNYLEQQLGETANLRGQRLIYGNIVFLPHPIPVSRDDWMSVEHLTNASLDRYRKLVADHDSIVVPNVQAIVVAQLDQQTGEPIRLATRHDLNSLGQAYLDFLFEQVHITKFICDYAAAVATAYQQRPG